MAKEVAGKLVGNKKLEEKGKVERIRGEAQAELGDVPRKLATLVGILFVAKERHALEVGRDASLQ